MSKRRIDILNRLISKIESHIPKKDIKNNAISKADIGWQLDHSLKVINGVCNIMVKTKPEKYTRDFNMMRSILFPLCYIPRGRAKAPKIVIPPDVILEEELTSQLQEAKINVEKTKSLPEKSHFRHHVFGMLSKKQTLRFLEIHTKHHLKIVDDILK